MKQKNKLSYMTGIGDRTALRDLNDLEQRGFMIKVGKLKGARYYLNVPYLTVRKKIHHEENPWSNGMK